MRHLTLLLTMISMLVMADAGASSKDFALHQAVLDQDIQLVRRLLSKGAAIDVIGSRKYGYGSALHLAVREGHLDIAKLLLDRGAQIDVLDPDDFTPLHNAAWNGNLEMAQLLLDTGADIEASTYDGDTPLKLAQNNDQAQVAAFIQTKLQASSGVATKVRSTTTGDSEVIDFSGTYLVDVSGEPKFIKYILNGVKLEDRPVFEFVQKGDQITVRTSGAKSSGYRPIFASLDGNTVNMKWWDARVKMIVKPGGKELVGSVVYTGGMDIRNNAELKLTKIETEADSIDISGIYTTEITYRKDVFKYDYRWSFGSKPDIEISIEQQGDVITGVISGGRSGKIDGVLKGNEITYEFYFSGGGISYEGKGTWMVSDNHTLLSGTWEHTSGHLGFINGEMKLTKIETEADSIDISGTYISEVTGPYRNKLGLIGANPEVKLVQEGSNVTGTFEPGGKLWGEVNGDSIEFDYFSQGFQGKGNWKVKFGGNEMVGTWTYKESIGKDGDWTLTKIDADD